MPSFAGSKVSKTVAKDIADEMEGLLASQARLNFIARPAMEAPNTTGVYVP